MSVIIFGQIEYRFIGQVGMDPRTSLGESLTGFREEIPFDIKGSNKLVQTNISLRFIKVAHRDKL